MLTDDYQSYETYAALVALSAPQTSVYRISEGKGTRDMYGFNAGMKEEIGRALADAARKFVHNEIVRATVELDDERKLIVTSWAQAANLCERLTGCGIFSIMDGKPEKLASRSKLGQRWNATH